MQALASSIALQTIHPPRVGWNPDFTKLTIDGEILDLAALRSGLRAVYDKCVETLLSLTGEGHFEFKIDADVRDNLRNRQRGASFLENPEYANAHHGLLERLVTHPSWRICFVASNGTIHWNIPALVRFFTLTSSLINGLAFLLHIVPSLPQRGTEFMDTKIRNTSCRLRNMFFICMELYNIGMYTKMTNITRHDSFIPSLIPDELRNIAVAYLAEIRPIEVLLSRVLWNATAASHYEEYFFVNLGRRMTSEDLTRLLQATFKEHMDVSLGVNAWRHAAVAVQREFVPSSYLRGGDRETDLSTGHTTEMARSRYALEENALQRLTADALWEFRIIDGIWHCILGFGKNAPPLPLRLAGLPSYAGDSGMQKSDTSMASAMITAQDLNNIFTLSYDRIKGEMRNEMTETMKGAFAWALENIPDDFRPRSRLASHHQMAPKTRELQSLPPSSPAHSSPNSFHPAQNDDKADDPMELPLASSPEAPPLNIMRSESPELEYVDPPEHRQVDFMFNFAPFSH